MKIKHIAKTNSANRSSQQFTIDDILEEIKNSKLVKETKNGKTISVYNVPCAFDIETYSNDLSADSTQNCKGGSEKCTNMYAWTLGLNHHVIFGRTWSEFEEMCEKIEKVLLFSPNVFMFIYVHNLAYEFQFLAKRFEWEHIFAVKERKVVSAQTKGGIVFKCSYILTGKSLATIGNELRDDDIKKMVGDLDYSKPRHSDTPMTDAEIGYCVNDVRVVMAKIQECIKADGSILDIPNTNTGYVRRYMRRVCLMIGKKKNVEYTKLMQRLHLDVAEYKLGRTAFMGGFTHANAKYVQCVLKNVASRDLQSSYPAVMCAFKFPMSKGVRVDIDKLKREVFIGYTKSRCCLMTLVFKNIKARDNAPDNIISLSKCSYIEEYVQNNGRVVSAKELMTTCTEVDLEYYGRFYEWDEMKAKEMWVYEKEYLPTEFVEGILKLYVDKTTLKGVKGSEDLYMLSKGMLNSCYGMCATDIGKPDIEYDGDIEGMWKEGSVTLEERIAKYNKDNRRFISYLWGVWTTAHARARLYEGMLHLGDDYIYSDTDSVKYLNKEKHEPFFQQQNDKITSILDKAMQYHGIDIEKTRPLDKKGNKRQLGIWEDETGDDDGLYTLFKTLGAKRYLVQQKGKLKLTVSGLGKNAIEYLNEVCDNDVDKIFEMFDDGMYIPADRTGKKTHHYIDFETNGVVVDYTGNEGIVHEMSSVHLAPQDFEMSISSQFLDYLLNRRKII